MKNKLGLSKITLALILSGFSFMSFAAEVSNKTVDKEELSQIRLKIQKEKLNQEYEQEKLNKLRIQQEQSKIENQMISPSISGTKENYMEPTEEDRLSHEKEIPQNVGFIYKNDQTEASSPKSNNILDVLTSEGEPNPNASEGGEDLSKVLQKFDDLKKESDSTLKVATEYVVVKTLVGTELDMLSIYDGKKSAKVRFSYMHDDGIQKRKVISVVSVVEGKTFKVEDDIYKVESLDRDGVVIINTKNNEEIILTKNS